MTDTDTTHAQLPDGYIGRHFPRMPPKLPGETADAYTDRLTGADKTGRYPYDHVRNRQCSIGWHGECSENNIRHDRQRRCKCPHHTEAGQLEMRVDELEEGLVAAWSLLPGNGKTRTAEEAARLTAWISDEFIGPILAGLPDLATWYLAVQTTPPPDLVTAGEAAQSWDEPLPAAAFVIPLVERLAELRRLADEWRSRHDPADAGTYADEMADGIVALGEDGPR